MTIGFNYNTGLSNYTGSKAGQLVVDASTLITLAKALLMKTRLLSFSAMLLGIVLSLAACVSPPFVSTIQSSQASRGELVKILQRTSTSMGDNYSATDAELIKRVYADSILSSMQEKGYFSSTTTLNEAFEKNGGSCSTAKKMICTLQTSFTHSVYQAGFGTRSGAMNVTLTVIWNSRLQQSDPIVRVSIQRSPITITRS